MLCSGACVDSQTSNVNCGACGNTCTDGKTCQAGSCVCSDPSTTDCNGQCVNLDASTTNCGECGNACVGLETCDQGVCFYDIGDDCGGAAKNVSITKVALFQAVEANLFDAGATVPTASRAVDVIQGKRAVVRVHLDVASGFSARTLSARVYLDNGDVQPEAFFEKKQVSADSVQGNLASTMNVTLPADKIQAGTKYYVELVECGGNATGTEGTTRIPATGTTNLEARKTGTVTVAFLPIRFNNLLPDTSSTALAKYADEVMKQYGTTGVVTSVLPTYSQSFTGTPNLSELLNSVVRAQRNADNPAGHVYYYGLVRSTDNFGTFCGGGCTTGVAYVATQSPAYRAGIGIGFADGVSAGTFAHELGHSHGRNHAPCGGAGGPDENFPYSGGGIGKWGFDIGAAQLKDPAQYKDLMGYCGPNWVSDYNYKAMSNEIATTNTVAGQRIVGEPQIWDTISVDSTGATWSVPQQMTELPTEHRVDAVVYDAQGNEILRVDAYQIDLSEDQGYLLVVPQRQSGWAAIGKSGDVALLYP